MHLHHRLASFLVFAVLTATGCGGKTTEPAASPAGSGVGDSATAAATSAPGQSSTGESEAPAAGPGSSAAASPAAVGKTSGKPRLADAAKPSSEQLARWSIPDYEPLQLLACGDGFGDPAVLGLAVSPDGQQFALSGVLLTLRKTGDPQPTVELLSKYTSEQVDRPLQALAISPDGVWIAAGDQKGTVRLWTLADQHEVVVIPAHQGPVNQLAFSPDARLLATTSYSGDVNLWQLPKGDKLKTLKVSEQKIAQLAFVTDNLLAAAASETSIWNIESGQKETTLTPKPVLGPAVGLSANRRVLAFNDSDAVTRLWDVSTSQPNGVALRGGAAHRIAFSHDAKRIATYGQDSNIRIWDAATGSVVQVIDADGGRTSALEWLPQANALVVASEQGRVRIWGTRQAASDLGIQPLELPVLAAAAPGVHKPLSSAQLQQVIDIRSFPQLPGALPQWSKDGLVAYIVAAGQKEAELFYRYFLAKAGWTEASLPANAQPGLLFTKDGCQLAVTLAPAPAAGSGAAAGLQVSLQFSGNYDARWLPKFAPIESPSSFSSFGFVMYRTKADLTDVEVGLLKQLHAAGWTAYSRLAAASKEDPQARHLALIQGGSTLTVMIGRPADAPRELAVQMSVGVTNKSLPVPPDAGWIELDNSTDLQLVAHTKLGLKQTADFFDQQMAAEGWLAREARRNFKDDKAWLPYIRGQQDVFVRLTELPAGGTQIVVGDVRNSWQLPEPKADAGKPDPADTAGLEAADFVVPPGATAVKFNADQKQIEFELPGGTPAQLGKHFVDQMEAAGWPRSSTGIESDDYVFITYTKGRKEVQLRARLAGKNATAQISGDGLLWTKPLSAAPERVSYETWLRRDHQPATLDRLDEFAAEMHKIPAGGKGK